MTHYRGVRAALPTRHAKERVIGPQFASILGLDVIAVDIDTDAFGTFAGDVRRIGSPFETAVRKARAGMERAALPIGIASEGTIASDPFLPGVTTDTELIVFVDDQRGIVVPHTHRSHAIVAFTRAVDPDEDLDAAITDARFPDHGLIARPEGLAGPITKGIRDRAELTDVIRHYASLSPGGRVLLESDFRAHMSPSRMAVIEQCARLLAERLASECPACGCPGWGEIEPAWGLPCESCGTTVPHAIRADRLGCPACPEVREVPRSPASAEPRWCPHCNP